MAEKHSRSNDGDGPSTKKIKVDDNNITNKKKNRGSIHNTTKLNPSCFKVTKILHNNSMRKFISVEGKFEDFDSPAIVMLEQKSFPNDKVILEKNFFNKDTNFQKIFTNDIYGNYNCVASTEHNSLHATVIHPATQKHIKKYTKAELYIIDETYELYQQVTLPHIESLSFSLEWVTNILEHKAEQDNVIYEDPDKNIGFILVTDLKWDRQLDTLKLLAMPFQKMRSLRELNASHLPLLKNIQDAGIEAITKKFNIPSSQLRIYFHYLPSYYYLHVHFSYLMFDAPGIYVEKAHLLSTVIRNLELMPDYYTKAVLSYAVSKDTVLYNKFKMHGVL